MKQTIQVGTSVERLKTFISKWKELTQDKLVLSWISGLEIPFHKKPQQYVEPSERKWSEREKLLLSSCINKLLNLGAIQKVEPCDNQFISNVFMRPKPDGSYRLILNLKKLNMYVKTRKDI